MIIKQRGFYKGGSLLSIFLISLLCSLFGTLQAQQLYDNFEGNYVVDYFTKDQALLKVVRNPSSDSVNRSKRCGKYTRSAKQYDNFTVMPMGKFIDISKYVTHDEGAPKIKMKVLTNAPAGTLIELHFCKKAEVEFPDGTNSQFQAYTIRSGGWQELEFKFAQIPAGSQTSMEQVTQINLVFNPDSYAKDVYYFDDIVGPEILYSEPSVSKD
jgi:hypothetical protein